MKPIVCFENVCFQYDQRKILNNISFQVSQGSFFIIIGPNGSGKTSLLKTLSGLEKSSSGQISILNKPIYRYSTKELATVLAYVPQTAPVDFPFTVIDIVRMGRAPHLGIFGDEKKDDLEIARQAMIFTNTDHLANRKINQLSGGECQRVNIARAICQQPHILLLDEPTASLDLGHQTRIMDLMEKLKTEQDMTIIMISHDINLAALYGDHILVLKNGDIVAQGSANDVMTFDILETAYQCIVLVDESPLGKYPRITLVPEKYHYVID